ncbi:MAG: hypothetical protein H7A21_11010 [Spirochaetales bacterium]|nr:hypothetical protein [Leptospiraceae bacterium]MCP5481954.1 hypothetical protein [Spirochaetales bacterium]
MGLPPNRIKRAAYVGTTNLASNVASVLLSIYQATLEFIVEGDDHLRLLRARKQTFIAAVWHTYVDAAIFALHSRGICIYSDHPRTPQYERSWTHFFREIGIKTIRSMGYEVLDASLGKQSKGIIDFIKTIRGGVPALVAPDGPHGPNYEAKPGVIYMAHKSDSVVVPIGFGCSRRVVGPNWDDFAIPLPFSRVAMVIGEPIWPESDTSDEALAYQARRMEAELDRLCFRANDLLFGTSTAASDTIHLQPG